MALELAFTPSGHLTAVDLAIGDGDDRDKLAKAEAEGQLKKVAKAFAVGQGAGLFLLATERFEGGLPPSFTFFRSTRRRSETLCGLLRFRRRPRGGRRTTSGFVAFRS
jgi:hypothetical protein